MHHPFKVTLSRQSPDESSDAVDETQMRMPGRITHPLIRPMIDYTDVEQWWQSVVTVTQLYRETVLKFSSQSSATSIHNITS